MSPTSVLDENDYTWKMSSKDLDKLEQLASQRVDRSSSIFVRENRELEKIDQQFRELRTLNQQYQQSLLGDSGVSPQVLEHRRAFVEQLTQKLTVLAGEREQKAQVVQNKARVRDHHTAQHAALGIVNRQRTELSRIESIRHDQKLLDANAQAQHIQKQNTKGEQGND